MIPRAVNSRVKTDEEQWLLGLSTLRSRQTKLVWLLIRSSLFLLWILWTVRDSANVVHIQALVVSVDLTFTGNIVKQAWLVIMCV